MHRVKSFSGWKRHRKPRDGQTFAKSCRCQSDHFHRSQFEAGVCNELRLRKLAKDIKDYAREVRQKLELDGLALGTYIADFVIEHNDGTIEILEAKGIQFQKFRRDWKILEHMNRHNSHVKLTLMMQR